MCNHLSDRTSPVMMGGQLGAGVEIILLSVSQCMTDNHHENVSIQCNSCVSSDKVCDSYSDSNYNKCFEVSGQHLYTNNYLSQQTVDGSYCQF